MNVKHWTRGASLAAALLIASAASSASAGPLYTVKHARGPHDGGLIAGQGSWITNKPYGYYIGFARQGARFNHMSTSKGHAFGRIMDGPNMCGWLLPDALGPRVGSDTDSCSERTRDALRHRRNIGKDFSARAHGKDANGRVDRDNNVGIKVAARKCPLYRNYYHGTVFTKGAGADPAGETTFGYVYYRYTTLDGEMAVVHAPSLGWGFIDVGCVTRPRTLYNDSD